MSVGVVSPADLIAEQSSPPEADEIRRELERILRASDFEAPERSRKFLRYVVEETLAGRSDRIKAYAIATQVFGRGDNFDPQNDPAVRIEAGRVRRSLERYYLKDGQHDPVMISIPKGAYVPLFSRTVGIEAGIPSIDAEGETWWFPARRNLLALAVIGVVALATFILAVMMKLEASVPSSAGQMDSSDPATQLPRVLVDPVTDLSKSANSAMLAQGLTDEIVGQLAAFRDITVIGDGSPAAGDQQGERSPVYRLQGRLTVVESSFRLAVQLLDPAEGTVLWTSSYDEMLDGANQLAVERSVAQSIVTVLAPPYGVIHMNEVAHAYRQPMNGRSAYACTLYYYSYRTDLDPDSYSTLHRCLKDVVKRYPGYSTAWAFLSLTYLDQLRFHYGNGPVPSSLSNVFEAADKAVELDPRNIRALQAKMLAEFFAGDLDTALQIGAQAYAINPNDTEFTGEYGFRLALAGNWSTGCPMISNAIDYNPASSSYFASAMALCAYMREDFAGADHWIRRSDLVGNPVYHLIKTAILGQAGRSHEAANERLWLEKNASVFLSNLPVEVATRLRRPEDQKKFFDGLRKAGVGVTLARE